MKTPQEKLRELGLDPLGTLVKMAKTGQMPEGGRINHHIRVMVLKLLADYQYPKSKSAGSNKGTGGSMFDVPSEEQELLEEIRKEG